MVGIVNYFFLGNYSRTRNILTWVVYADSVVVAKGRAGITVENL